ncbi:hypothetical protein HZC53_05815 [Candidatus Uhrbacteria bacterium]|nr:hypothetical protein [Candidatus Uhrbacteria bacterium]
MNEPSIDKVKAVPNPLLEGPEEVEISQERAEEQDSSFTWDSHESRITFGVSGGKTYMRLVFRGELPTYIPEQERSKFVSGEEDGEKVFVYALGQAPPAREKPQPDGREAVRYLAPPLEGGDERVRETDLKRLTEYLKSHRVAFYTGAGISLAAGVHDMQRLKTVLGVHEIQSAEDFATKALRQPDELMETWQEFVDAMSKGPPTPAHQALAEIAKKLKCKIFTENLDRLHELTGIRSIHVDAAEISESVQEDWMRGLDAIVTVGLRTDDNGLLAWYKKLNPKGKIIAMNLEQPVYAGAQDYLLKGDLQQTVPELERTLVTKT